MTEANIKTTITYKPEYSGAKWFWYCEWVERPVRGISYYKSGYKWTKAGAERRAKRAVRQMAREAQKAFAQIKKQAGAPEVQVVTLEIHPPRPRRGRRNIVTEKDL